VAAGSGIGAVPPWKYRDGRAVADAMEEMKFDLQSPAPSGAAFPAGMLTVRVVGGPTALLELGGVRLLTDPTFSPAGVHESAPGRPLTKTEGPAFGLDAIGSVAVVLLSHDQHADNLDPAGRQSLVDSPLTLTTEAAALRLGGTARSLASWDTVALDRPEGGTLEITAVPARHGPEGCEPLTGDVTGFIVSGTGLPTVYVSGDNASLDIVRDIAERIGTIDVALLFAGAARTSLFDGAPLTLTSADAAAAAQLLGARWIVPLHVRGWAHFSEGPAMCKQHSRPHNSPTGCAASTLARAPPSDHCPTRRPPRMWMSQADGHGGRWAPHVRPYSSRTWEIQRMAPFESVSRQIVVASNR